MRIAFIDTLGLCYDGSTLSKRGLGGSESAVILLARELSAIGFDVTVFNDCSSDDASPGLYDGVIYAPLRSVEFAADPYDVVIGSRSVAAFASSEIRNTLKSFTGPLPDFQRIVQTARHKILWMHDTFCDGDQYLEQLVLDGCIDEIFTLSDWHTSYVLTCDHGKKRMYEALKDHVFVTRNGIQRHIDWVDIKQKDRNLFVYNASVTKGMVPLVTKIWPLVKARIPNAKLMVLGGYYKFREDSPADEQEQLFQSLVDAYDGKDGVTFTGIIRQDQVAETLAAASYTIYPGVFPETFGISTLESIAYNTPVLACRFGALEETAIDAASYKIDYPVEPNGLFPLINTDTQVQQFADMVVTAYNNPYLHQQKMYACNKVHTVCEWSTVAIQWKQHLYHVLDEFLPIEDYRYVTAINARIREVFGRRMINREELYVPRLHTQRRIEIITPVFNGQKFIGRCIRSIASQDYVNYHVTIINDSSTDNTLSVISDTLSALPSDLQKKFSVVDNHINVGAVCNQVTIARSKASDSIIALIDGDDWLMNDPNIFQKFNNIYAEGAMFTYGSCWSLADSIPLIAQQYPPEVMQTRGYRQYKFNWNMPYTHMRTFSNKLLTLVDDSNFKNPDGEWYKAGGDGSLFYSLIEVADPRTVVCLPDVVYVYNDLNPINDYKINSDEQTKNADMIVGTPVTKKILIAVPTAKYIEPDTFKSIYDLHVPEGYEATFQYFYGYSIDQIRNLIAQWTVERFDYLFAVDSDIVFAPDTLQKLLANDKPIVSGIYRQRLEPQRIEIYDHTMKHVEYDDIADLQLTQVGGCGFGCVLVKAEVFSSVGYPYFEYHSALNHANTFSEDLDFCSKAVSKGFTVWVDPSIICGHIGSTTLQVTRQREPSAPTAPLNAYIIVNSTNPTSVEYAAACKKSVEDAGLNPVMWEAPYYKTADELWGSDASIPLYQPTMVPPAASCTAAHIALWRHIASNGETAVILEHDAVMLGNPVGNIPDGKIIALGYRVSDFDGYNPDKYRQAVSKHAQTVIDIPTHRGSHAYAITAETARMLLEEIGQVGVMVSIDASHFLRDDPLYASEIPLAIMSPPPAIAWVRESTIWCDGAERDNAELIDSFKSSYQP